MDVDEDDKEQYPLSAATDCAKMLQTPRRFVTQDNFWSVAKVTA